MNTIVEDLREVARRAIENPEMTAKDLELEVFGLSVSGIVTMGNYFHPADWVKLQSEEACWAFLFAAEAREQDYA